MTLLSLGLLTVPAMGIGADTPNHLPAREHLLAGPSTSPLSISAFSATPSAIFSGNLVFINLTAQGGSPPYSYWYRGLPPGCSTENNSSIQCHPRDSQHYLLEGTVNDSAGHQANASTNLTVSSGFGPPPQIQSFVATPSTGAVGRASYFVVTAISRSATPTEQLAYAYIGLPPGCTTFNQTNLTCVPNAPGEYQVWVRVTDGFSQFSQTSLFFNVTGSAPTTPSGAGVSWTTIEYVILALVVVGVGTTAYLMYARKPPKKPEESPPPRADFKPFQMD